MVKWLTLNDSLGFSLLFGELLCIVEENLLRLSLEILYFYFCLGALSASSILGGLDSKYRDQLNLYLATVLQNSSHSRFVKCWHAKTDGWALSTFHSNCDGKGPTVTIKQVGNYIFGGYTDVSWFSKYHLIAARVILSHLMTPNVFLIVLSRWIMWLVVLLCRSFLHSYRLVCL